MFAFNPGGIYAEFFAVLRIRQHGHDTIHKHPFSSLASSIGTQIDILVSLGATLA
jgi:hypothetical protein